MAGSEAEATVTRKSIGRDQEHESDAPIPPSKDGPPTVPPKDTSNAAAAEDKNMATIALSSPMPGDSPAQTGASMGVGFCPILLAIADLKSGTLRYR